MPKLPLRDSASGASLQVQVSPVKKSIALHIEYKLTNPYPRSVLKSKFEIREGWISSNLNSHQKQVQNWATYSYHSPGSNGIQIQFRAFMWDNKHGTDLGQRKIDKNGLPRAGARHAAPLRLFTAYCQQYHLMAYSWNATLAGQLQSIEGPLHENLVMRSTTYSLSENSLRFTRCVLDIKDSSRSWLNIRNSCSERRCNRHILPVSGLWDWYANLAFGYGLHDMQ